MIRFIRYFMMEWANYPGYYWFAHVHTKPETLEQMGGDPYKNRFDYAWQNAKIHWKHRDRYSSKCDGECETCTAKHC